MQTIAIAALKGGVGKTTTSVCILQAAARSGYKCLGIDLDPQGDMTDALCCDWNQSGAWDALHGGKVEYLLQTSPQGIDVLAGTADLATETTTTGSALRLNKALKPVKGNYGLIVIDTPYTAGELAFNAACAADGLIVPLESDRNAIRGGVKIIDVFRRANPEIEIIGTVITRFDAHPLVNQAMLEDARRICAAAGAPVIGVIRQNIVVREAVNQKVSIFDYEPNSNAAKDYMKLWETIKGM